MCTTQVVFSASWDTDRKPTIREMQEDIQELQQEKSLLEFKWKTFQIWNSSLWDLLRQDLTVSESQSLWLLVETYNTDNILWENKLQELLDTQKNEEFQSLRKQLLILKKDFYTSLIPYVDPKNIDELKIYIDSDISLNEKSKNVSSKIQKIQSSKQERVQELQVKIEDNNKIIRENIEKRISTEVRSRLDVFVNETNFASLPTATKIEIFEKLIRKLEYESIRLMNLQNTTSIIEEKILVFRVVINLLKEYTSSWRE